MFPVYSVLIINYLSGNKDIKVVAGANKGCHFTLPLRVPYRTVSACRHASTAEGSIKKACCIGYRGPHRGWAVLLFLSLLQRRQKEQVYQQGGLPKGTLS